MTTSLVPSPDRKPARIDSRVVQWEVVEPALLEALGKHCTRAVACRIAGVSPGVIRQREKVDAAFRARVLEASSRTDALIERNLFEILEQRDNLPAAMTMGIFLAKSRLDYNDRAGQTAATNINVGAGANVLIYLPDNGRGDRPRDKQEHEAVTCPKCGETFELEPEDEGEDAPFDPNVRFQDAKFEDVTGNNGDGDGVEGPDGSAG